VQARVNGSLEHEDAAVIVLSVTLALGITNDLGWMVRQVLALLALLVQKYKY
jgi:hypothetical protein